MKASGVTIMQVKLAPKDAIDLLEKALRNDGITIYGRIDQQDEARKAGVRVLPIEYILFGNPAKGAPVMKLNPLAALDLPLKVIAYQDERQNNFIVFNTAKYITDRFGLSSSVAQQIDLAPLLLKIFN